MDFHTPPDAEDDNAIVAKGGSVDIDVLANDTDDSAIDETTVAQGSIAPSNGSITDTNWLAKGSSPRLNAST